MFMIRMFLVLWLLAPSLLQAVPDLLSIRLGESIGTYGELVRAGLCERATAVATPSLILHIEKTSIFWAVYSFVCV